RNDHFFELGGHSLLVMQLVIRVRDQFHVDVPLRALFEKPVLWSLAQMVIAARIEVFSDSDVADVEKELGDLSESELLAMLSKESAYER
ncbi:MAG: phosphopantetheine-binding protein, partial [Pseudomonadota bacterium]|nr:phosphopantetheine-binding protein [Pseudomonadota bacterium]